MTLKVVSIMNAHQSIASPLGVVPPIPPMSSMALPVMTREAFANAIGLPVGVLIAQAERGLWGAPIRIGKRSFINVEFVRLLALKQAQEFI